MGDTKYRPSSFASNTLTAPMPAVLCKAKNSDILSHNPTASATTPSTLARPPYSARPCILQNLSSASPSSPSTKQQQVLKGAEQASPASLKKDQQLHYYNYWAITPFGINASSSFVYKPRIDQSSEPNPANVDQIMPTRPTSHTALQNAIARPCANLHTVQQSAGTPHEATETQLLENQALHMPLESDIDNLVCRNGEGNHPDDVIHAYHVNQRLQQIHRCMLEGLRDQSTMQNSTTAREDLKDIAMFTHQHKELQKLMDQSLPQQVSIEASGVENEIKEMPSVRPATNKIVELDSSETSQAIKPESCGPATSACSSSNGTSICETKQSTILKVDSILMEKLTEEANYEFSHFARKDSDLMEKCVEESECKASSNMPRMESKFKAKDMQGSQYNSPLNMSRGSGNSKEKCGVEGKHIEPLGQVQEILKESDEDEVLNRPQSISLLNNVDQAAGLALDLITDPAMYCAACTSTDPYALHVGLCGRSCLNYMHANFNTGDDVKELCFLYQYDYTVQAEYEQHHSSLQYYMQPQENDVVQDPALFTSASPLPFADHDLLVDGDPLDEQALHIWDYSFPS